MDADLQPAIATPPGPAEVAPPPPAGGFLRRAVWSFAGQAVSSGSNFLLSVVMLSVAPAREFAVFSVCIVTYGLILQLARASIAVPATLLRTGAAGADSRQERAAIGVTVGVAMVASTVLLAVSSLAGAGRSLLVVLGLSLPFLLFQDALRYACYARGRPSVAAASDLAWLAVQVVASTVLIAADRDSATTLLAAWAGAGTVSGLATGAYLRLRPAVGAAAAWIRSHRALWQRLLGEFVVASSSHQAVYYGLAIVAGAGELGRVKATQTLLGPVVVLILGGGALGVPESVRAAGDLHRLRNVTVRLSTFLVVAALLCGTVAYAVIPEFGPDLFPHAWEGARPLIPVLSLFAAAVGASTGATSALRALDHNAWLLRVRAVSGLVVVVAGVALSAWWGAGGALASVAAVEGGVALIAWRRFLGVLRAGAATG